MKLILFLGGFLFLMSCQDEKSSHEDSIEEKPSKSYPELIDEGMFLLEENMPSDALPLFEEAIRLNSDSIRGYYGIAYAYTLLGVDDQEACKTAIEYWEQVENMASCYRYTSYNKGNCLDRILEYDKAIEAYTEAISCDKTEPEPYMGRAEMKKILGDTSGFCSDKIKGYSLIPRALNAKEKAYYDNLLKYCSYHPPESVGLDLKNGMSVTLELADTTGLSD